MDRTTRLAAILAAGMLAAGGLAACGGDDEDTGGGAAATTEAPAQTQGATETATTEGSGDQASAQGKEIFTANCASCHTLSDAGASGQVGPNLDDLQPSAETVEAKVKAGGGGMPSFEGQLSAAEIAAVAAYVSGAAGK